MEVTTASTNPVKTGIFQSPRDDGAL